MVGHDSRGTMDQSNDLKIIRHPLFQTKLPPWFDLRVFYVRISNFVLDDSTPEYLILNHIPLGPDTILEVNGGRSSAYSECVSTKLRRDRVDKNSDEATFVNTDSMRITGSLMFEVLVGDDLLLSGVLELCNPNGFAEEGRGVGRKWAIKCQTHAISSRTILKQKQSECPETPLPTIDVYVAGCFSGTPIILSKTLHPGYSAKNHRNATLDSIPENDAGEAEKDVNLDSAQIPECDDLRTEDNDEMIHYKNSLYGGSEYIEDDDGELSWFNAGVRVGVGIGLGICIGAGVGIGLLVRSYQSASRSFRRRLL